MRHSHINKDSKNSNSNNKEESKEETTPFPLKRRPEKNLSTIQTHKKQSPLREKSNKSLVNLKSIDNTELNHQRKPLFYL